MHQDLTQLGYEIRRARQARGFTQAQLAQKAHLTRTTLNRLENGLVTDLGICKVQAILHELGLSLAVEAATDSGQSNYLRLAATSASVSFKTALTGDELRRALLTGKVPASRRPHIRTLLEEANPALLKALVEQLSSATPPGKVERNLSKLAAAVGLPASADKWSKT
ncbi:MAG: helix-turn-helix transcriptional regulator [Proteobacteria bacterium]|nr:helix-turn-helix transcriptional regulator [Pseudomonadota bacterium]